MFKFKPIKLQSIPLVKRDSSLIHRHDSDFDSLPNHLDCNPINPFQQDNDKLGPKTSDWEDTQSKAIDVEPSYEEPPYEPIKSTLKRKSTESQELKKAQQALKTTHGAPTYLFLKHRTQGWLPTPHKTYTSQDVADMRYEIEREAQEILNDPTFTDYKFTEDKFFPQRQSIKQQSIERRTTQIKQNVRQAFAPSQSRPASYGGPSTLPKTPILGRNTPTSIMDEYSSNFTKPKLPYESSSQTTEEQPIIDIDEVQIARPAGYQEKSLFPLHSPYRPITFGFVGKPRKYEQFKPPIVKL